MDTDTQKTETIADIAAKIRSFAANLIRRPFSWQMVAGLATHLADRIEAAAKRDAAIHAMTCEANERLREHLENALEGKPGNAAAMRAALEGCMHEMCERCGSYMADNMQTPRPCPGCVIVDKARAALAAPARNCDRYETADEAKKTFDDFCRRNYKPHVAARGLDGCDDCELCETKNENGPNACPFAWLFAPAGKEGGAE